MKLALTLTGICLMIASLSGLFWFFMPDFSKNFDPPKIIMVKAHVECSSELVWQCVKKNNAYVRASVNRTRMSAEKGNVTAKHGFSSSGKT